MDFFVDGPSAVHDHLIGGVKLGKDEDQDRHSADCAMDRPGGDVHERSRADVDDVVAKTHPGVGIALEDIVGLGQGAMVVGFRIL